MLFLHSIFQSFHTLLFHKHTLSWALLCKTSHCAPHTVYTFPFIEFLTHIIMIINMIRHMLYVWAVTLFFPPFHHQSLTLDIYFFLYWSHCPFVKVHYILIMTYMTIPSWDNDSSLWQMHLHGSLFNKNTKDKMVLTKRRQQYCCE